VNENGFFSDFIYDAVGLKKYFPEIKNPHRWFSGGQVPRAGEI